MKKILVIALVTVAAAGAFARPCGPHGPGGWHHPPHPGFHHPPHPGFHHPPHGHGGGWGHGGCNFWPGFVGGVIGGAIASRVVEPTPVVVTTPVVTTPVVVTQPTVVTQPAVVTPVATPSVWVEGRYVDQVQANGTVVRVWQPGHYVQ